MKGKTINLLSVGLLLVIVEMIKKTSDSFGVNSLFSLLDYICLVKIPHIWK